MGNNSHQIFFSKENYRFFINKIEREIKPVCEILAYCIMPNHYHLMVLANEASVQYLENTKLQKLSRKIGTMQSSYSQAINKEKGTLGSIFRQKTKAKSLSQVFIGAKYFNKYALNCFLYIHQNPIKAGLVRRYEDWEFSSFNEYSAIKENRICNISLAYSLLGIEQSDLSSVFERNIYYKP